jgi:hypothetical protein
MGGVVIDLEEMRKELPPFLSRAEASRATGHLYAPGSFANMDSKGDGPPRVLIGYKTAYPRDGFLEWLATRIREPKPGKIGVAKIEREV